MTPGARVQAAIELLDGLEATALPADRMLSRYFRIRRFIGSKDRAAVRGMFYDVQRQRARLDWWIARCAPSGAPLGAPPGAPTGEAASRARVLALLALVEGRSAEEIAAAFDGGQYRPAAPSGDEPALFEALTGQPPEQGPEHPEQPAWVRGNWPEWLTPELDATFGARLDEEMAAMNAPAAVDLRVNTLKATRAEARAALAAEGVEAEPTALSPLGLRLAGRQALSGLKAFKDGLVEIQDEGSQLVSSITDARPGQRVLDFCAGGGGKALALAAAMANSGRLVACDIAPSRLKELVRRRHRAGVDVIETLLLPEEGGAAVAGLDAGSFDRVLLDVPCSGAGAWRRNPEARWRLTAEALAAHTARQAAILERAAGLVAPGGRLVYATCSILACENAPRIERFLAEHADFTPLPVAEIWDGVIGGAAPCEGPYLVLSPARHGTDGFFAAVLERRA